MIDFSKIATYPIEQRQNKFKLAEMIPLDQPLETQGLPFEQPIKEVAEALQRVQQNNGMSIFMLGGAVVKVGCSAILIDLMERGYIRHLAENGAVTIHDFELALIGETSEDVERGLEDGTFGMVEETGRLMNEAINAGYKAGIGYGQAVGRKIADLDLPFKDSSLLYRAFRLKIPVTVHIAIGGDIIHQHPTCQGAALGETSFQDFKTLTESTSRLQNGALLNFGSAVNLPEAFLKALTIARNLKYDPRDFTVANIDFIDMYRPRTRLLEWPKKLGCGTYDIRANHNQALPLLHHYLR